MSEKRSSDQPKIDEYIFGSQFRAKDVKRQKSAQIDDKFETFSSREDRQSQEKSYFLLNKKKFLNNIILPIQAVL